MAQSYVLGYLIDETTLCNQIKYLPGGHTLVLCANGRHRVERYHHFYQPVSHHGISSSMKFPEVAEQCLAEAVDNIYRSFHRLGYRPLATVSGGLDSRAVLSLLNRSGAEKIDTVAWGQPGSADARYGEAVARSFGLGCSFSRTSFNSRLRIRSCFRRDR